MRKYVLTIGLLIIVLNMFANTSRVYVQRIESPLFDLPSTYVSNAQEIKNINYLFTATKTHSSDTLSTATDQFTTISVYKIGDVAVAFLDLGDFNNQWAIDDTVQCTITFIEEGMYYGQSKSWAMVIPDNTDTPIEMLTFSKEISVPPFLLKSFPAINPSPSEGAEVQPGKIHLNWKANPSGSKPVGYLVKYANSKKELSSSSIIFLIKPYLDIRTKPSQEYYWQVMPSPLALRKNVTTYQISDEFPIWHFITKSK